MTKARQQSPLRRPSRSLPKGAITPTGLAWRRFKAARKRTARRATVRARGRLTSLTTLLVHRDPTGTHRGFSASWGAAAATCTVHARPVENARFPSLSLGTTRALG